jgi:hypothetical protein
MTNTKKKNKNTRKLLGAIGMLSVSAAMLVSSTFAWFAMNKKVTASTMQITATSSSPYLVISEASDGTFDTDANAMQLTPVTDTALKLVTPLNVASNVAYYADAAAKTAGTTTTPTKFSNAASVLWGTTNSSDPALVEASNVTTQVPAGDLAEYVQTSELWFKVVAVDQPGTNLKCTKVTFTNANGNSIAASGRVLLVSETGKYQLFKLVAGDVTTAETGSDSALIASLNNTTAQKVTAYFYFDGTDNSAYTNNATNLSGVSASFEFEID